MKCTYCGYNLNIDDEFCSFCGKENTHAVQHRKDMKHYHDDYIHTKQVIFEKSEKKVGLIAKVTIIVSLMLAFVLILYATNNTFKIRDWADKTAINNNIKTHKQNLDRLEAERDFFGLNAYFETHDLYLSDDLQEYRAIVNLSSFYQYIFENTFSMLNIDENSYRSMEDYIESISSNISYFYDKIEYNEYLSEQYSKTHMAAMQDLAFELKTFIQVYLNVPKEDIERFPELSAPKIQLIIERSMGYNED